MTYRKLQRGWTLGSAQAILAFIIVTFVLFVAWARHYEIEEVARTSGQIIAVARTQYIQAANDGVIAELLVKEGQVVKKGEVLARLERAQSEAAVDDSRGKVAALTAAVVRLRAEVFNKPLTFPASVKAFPTFVENQKQLFSRRQRALHEEAQSLTSMLKAAQDELRVSEPLLVTGDISRLEITRLQKSIYELQGQITNRRNKYAAEAFTHDAIDFLLKPLRAERLEQALQKAEASVGAKPVRSNAPGHLKSLRMIRGHDLVWAPLTEVRFFEAQKKYTRVVLKDQDGLLRMGIGSVAQHLDVHQFWRIHRGIILNVAHMAAANRDDLGRMVVRIIDRKEKLIVSRPYEHLFKDGFS